MSAAQVTGDGKECSISFCYRIDRRILFSYCFSLEITQWHQVNQSWETVDSFICRFIRIFLIIIHRVAWIRTLLSPIIENSFQIWKSLILLSMPLIWIILDDPFWCIFSLFSTFFERADMDHDGTVDFNELLVLIVLMSRLTDLESRLAFAFDMSVQKYRYLLGNHSDLLVFLGGMDPKMVLSNVKNWPMFSLLS